MLQCRFWPVVSIRLHLSPQQLLRRRCHWLLLLPPIAAVATRCCCHLQRALFGGDCPPGLGVLPVTVYLDKTLQSIGGRQYYPMLIGFPTLPRESVFKHGCYERLALLPALEADPSISLKASSVRWST